MGGLGLALIAISMVTATDATDYFILPTALRAATGVIAYNGGSLIYTAVAGGNWYAFVEGQSVAFTQSHILFG